MNSEEKIQDCIKKIDEIILERDLKIKESKKIIGDLAWTFKSQYKNNPVIGLDQISNHERECFNLREYYGQERLNVQDAIFKKEMALDAKGFNKIFKDLCFLNLGILALAIIVYIITRSFVLPVALPIIGGITITSGLIYNLREKKYKRIYGNCMNHTKEELKKIKQQFDEIIKSCIEANVAIHNTKNAQAPLDVQKILGLENFTQTLGDYSLDLARPNVLKFKKSSR